MEKLVQNPLSYYIPQIIDCKFAIEDGAIR